VNTIELFRVKTLRSALILEIKGMKRRGRSACAIAKQEYGLKGRTKISVLDQLEDFIEAQEKHLT
jgi:hypothetical protein